MATEKQIHFAEKLSTEKGQALPEGYVNFTTKLMSDLIDSMLKSPKLSLKDEFIEAGFYCLNGEVVKVQLNLAGIKHYAKRLTQAGGGTWHFNYESGLIAQLTVSMKLEREQAAAFGKIYGYCCICATRLTNEESISKGIGPICTGKQGW